jgi:predicted nucleic acid-binding protein
MLPCTVGVSRVWGRISADCEAKGRRFRPTTHGFAACCLSYDLALMTS